MAEKVSIYKDFDGVWHDLEDKAATAHIADKDNPHNVTKAQLGLQNVDNTADADKPISTAVQSALDKKQDVIDDITTIRTQVDANKSAIETLNGDETTNGSVKKQIADALAKIVADAPADFDTLKEISDWISSHTESASAMNTAINTNAQNIASNTKAIGDNTTAIAANTKALGGHTIGADVPENAQFTDTHKTWGLSIKNHTVSIVEGGTTKEVEIPDNDTTYGVATENTAGLMSAADKKAFDKLQSDFNALETRFEKLAKTSIAIE